MKKTLEPSPSLGSSGIPSNASTASNPYAEILDCAKSSGSKSRFMSKSLRILARRFQSPYAAIHAQFRSEVLQDDCHTGPSDPNFWKPSVQRFLTECLALKEPRARILRAKKGQGQLAYLCAPLYTGPNGTLGAVALMTKVTDAQDATHQVGQLDSLCRFMSLAAEVNLTPAQNPAPTTAPAATSAQRTTATTLEELAFAITNELRNKTGCNQIALGWVRRSHVDILSISGLDEVRRNSPGIVSLRGAMEECLDAGRLMNCQRDEPWSRDDTVRYRLHLQWHRDTKGDSVASLPLQHAEKTIAILSLRRGTDRPFSREELDRIRNAVESGFSTTLLLADTAGRSLWRHVLGSIRGMCHSVAHSRWTGPKSIIGAALLMGAYLTFGSLPYRVTVPCSLVPGVVRQLSAPFEAPLLTGRVVEGDRVRKDQVLCEFDRQDLLRQQAEFRAQLAVQEREHDRALAHGTPYEAQLALANQVLTRERLTLVDRRLDQAVIRAPFDGIIISGDLRQRIGAVLPRGEPLFRIAPNDHWSIELEVPESQMAQLKKDMKGVFSTYAQPDVVYPISVRRIRASSAIRNGKNTFVAEAELQPVTSTDVQSQTVTSRATHSLRPGIQGVAAVDVGRRPIGWILTHRIIDYLRLHLWL